MSGILYKDFPYLSGGSGTDVEANPTGTPTDELNTIRIGQNIYEIVGGGSGGGSFEKELLYSDDYNTSRPNTITLSKSYENYDYLEFELWKWDDRNYYDKLGSTLVSKETLDNIKDGFKTGRTNVLNVYAWQPANQYIRFTIDSITQFTNVNSNGNFSISKIYGIKFGSGGEAYPIEGAVKFNNTDSFLYAYLNNEWVQLNIQAHPVVPLSIRVVTTATGPNNAAVAYGDPDESTSTYTTVVFTSVQSTPLNVENLFIIAYPSPWKIKSLIDGLKFTNNATGVTQILNTNDEISWTYLTAIDYTFSNV